MILSNDGQVLFTREELACPCCGRVRVMEPFVKELRALRERMNRSMRVNSCSRCESRNQAIGGHPRSLHVFNDQRGTCAIDIHIPDDAYRHRLVHMALDNGWSVGVYKTFVHLDMRTMVGLQPKVFWGGGSD